MNKKKPCGLDFCPLEEIIGVYASCSACAWGNDGKERTMSVIKVEHPNGYMGVLYGKSSMSIYDKDGHECLHTGSRTPNTEEELYEVLGNMPKFEQMVADMKGAEITNTIKLSNVWKWRIGNGKKK